MKVNILGTKYKVIMKAKPKDYSELNDNWGFMDETSKVIIIADLSAPDDDEFVKAEVLEQKVLRHEIIHAFLFESGLAECSAWAKNEEMVDFFARQFNKIQKAIKDCNISDS